MTLLHTRITGHDGGRTVVMLGALGSSVDMWAGVQDRLTERLGASGRVISIDHRGHGASPAPDTSTASGEPTRIADLAADVTETLDRLGVGASDAVDLVGLSIGGAVAQQLAGSPDTAGRVRTLTLMCTSPKFGSPDDWTAKATGVRAGGTSTLKELAEGTVPRWLTDGYRDRHPATALGVAEMIARTSPEGYAQCCEALSAFEGTPLLEAVSSPTLTVAGESDPTCPPETLKGMTDAVSGNGNGVTAGFDVVSPGAHLLPVEQPDRAAGLIAGQIGA